MQQVRQHQRGERQAAEADSPRHHVAERLDASVAKGLVLEMSKCKHLDPPWMIYMIGLKFQGSSCGSQMVRMLSSTYPGQFSQWRLTQNASWTPLSARIYIQTIQKNPKKLFRYQSELESLHIGEKELLFSKSMCHKQNSVHV